MKTNGINGLYVLLFSSQFLLTVKTVTDDFLRDPVGSAGKNVYHVPVISGFYILAAIFVICHFAALCFSFSFFLFKLPESKIK